ncbi:MAG TPA: hypothetical protein VNG71_03325 [Pyrinomonadaceae bacterium]|nr:hypothetical protein [Pyrinomonadaceae bacterium]
MSDELIKKQLARCINELERKANENIERHAYTGPGRSFYYDMLDAVKICRDQMSRVPESNDNVAYAGDVVRTLKAARERYRYEAADEGGYGVSTFHMIIEKMTSLFESLGGRKEDLEIPADNLKSQILYMTGEPWERCFRAFATGDYIGCSIEAQKIILEKTAPLRREVLLLMLISLRRMGQDDRAKELSSTLILPANYNDPWLTAMVEMIIGINRPDDVGALAQSEAQRCQFSFYAGERFLIDGQEVAASASFKACASLNVDCDERFLALAELHPANRAAIVSIYQLTLRAQRYQEARDPIQAIDLATHAYEMACRYIGEGDPVTISLTLRLALLQKAYG